MELIYKYNRKNLFIIYFMICFSGFFLVGLNKYFSPIYIIFILSVLLFFINILHRKKMCDKSFKILVFGILPILLILLFQNIYYGLKYGILNEISRHTMSLLYICILYFFINKKSLDYKLLSEYFIKFNMFLLLIEAFYRFLMNIIYNDGLSFGIYSFKMHSLLYIDSNFVGLHILGLFMFITIFNKHFGILKYNSLYLFLCIILLAFTFSRTVYIIFMLYLLIKYFNKYNKYKIFKIIFFISLILFIAILIHLISDDASFLTKLYILNEFINIFFYNTSLLTFLFGIGSGNSIDVINIGSHNLFGLIIEMGFIWFVVYIYILYILIRKKLKDNVLFLLPVLISGLISILPIAYMSFYYVGLLLIGNMKK